MSKPVCMLFDSGDTVESITVSHVVRRALSCLCVVRTGEGWRVLIWPWWGMWICVFLMLCAVDGEAGC